MRALARIVGARLAGPILPGAAATRPDQRAEAAAREPLAAIEGAAARGLGPEDCGRGRPVQALAAGEPAVASAVVSAGFRHLGTDCAEGRPGRAPRAGWRMETEPMTPARGAGAAALAG